MHDADVPQQDIAPDGIPMCKNGTFEMLDHEFCEPLMSGLSEIFCDAHVILIFDLKKRDSVF